jgi:SH3 domain protein
MNHRNAHRAHLALALAACVGAVFLAPSPASAEKAWVRDEIRLNLRTGPSVGNRIVGVVKTGDAVQVLSRGDGWTQVRNVEDGKEGWIPEGYLDPQAPPGIRLAEVEAHAAELETELARVSKQAKELGETNEVLASQDGEQEAQIKSLTLENMELKAGARYPEWITGALIFASGMLLGAILRSSFARRAPQRVRL